MLSALPHIALISGVLVAQPAFPGGVHSGGPLNETCPVTGRPVDAKVTTVYQEETIAFCCAGCRPTFLKWDEARKFDYVTQQVTRRAGGQLAAPPLASRDWPSDLYTLPVCPITDKKLGSMGDPSVHTVDGREVRFCCPPCLPRFEQRDNRWAAIDDKMIEDQRPLYPLETCIVSGKPLGEHPIDRIYRNRLVRFATTEAAAEFEKDPRPHLAKLDEAVIARQRAVYPLDTCIITGRPLGIGNAPSEVIVGGRLFRLADAGAVETLRRHPQPHMVNLEALRKSAPRR